MNPWAPTATVRLERMFSDQAAISPGAPAIFFRGQVVTYGELNAAAESLSLDLARQGVGPGVILGISLQRTPDLVAVLLATLKAGGAFLPLDGRTPPDRLRFMLADSGCRLVLTDAASPALGDFDGSVLELRGGALVRQTCGLAPEASAPADLAYLIHTSGSTGAPKGVMLGHGATHLIEWARSAYSPDDLSRVAATTSLSFDPSILEIFAPLSTGGAIILKENTLEAFAPDERPTLMVSVPSVLTELCRAGAIPASVKVLIAGGEPLKADLVREVFRLRPELVLQNHYGPTEATTVAAVANVPRALAGEPSIGVPVRGATVVLLDDHGQAVGDGETGEIHIGGPGLALGYLNRPELTSRCFIQGPDGRVYRTGDLGFWRGGQLYFAGRRDQQVKIRGFRVELGEVESALLKVADVEDALAVVRERAGRPQIVAYIQSSRSLSPGDVHKAVATWLPDYMLPARMVILSAFPRLVSGKVDRSALPEPTDEPGLAEIGASGLEKPIIHVFQEVLARAGVGPLDSFFELGGDSLCSVQAALRLGEILGYELPAALIHQAPTPRTLARALEHARLRAQGHVNLLEPGGPAPPLFCMADLFGHAFNYLSLSRQLSAERAVYGVTPGPLQDAFARNGDMAALTRAFTREIRGIRPKGPYLIAGYSAGGLLAMDVACALERAGEEVRLILLDSYLPAGRLSARALGRWGLKQTGLLFRRRSLGSGLQRLRSAIRNLRDRFTRRSAPAWIPRSQIGFATRMMRVGAAYRPGQFSGPSLVVTALGREPGEHFADDDRLMGWSEALRGPVTRTSVRGGHHQFLREPLVGESANAVRRFLRSYE